MLGRKFGSWQVVGVAPNKGKNWLVRCQCRCGILQDVSGWSLKSGSNRRCLECSKKDRMKFKYGRIIGDWTIIGKIKGDFRKIQCLCLCGSIVQVSKANLLSGTSTKCKECSDKCRIGMDLSFWNWISYGARERGIHIGIDWQFAKDLLNNQGWMCSLSGVPITLPKSWKDYRENGKTASLDRIDSSLGYIPGNVQWVHKSINQMKWDFPQSEFIEFCKLVAKHRK